MRKFSKLSLLLSVALGAGCGADSDPEAGSVVVQPVSIAPLTSQSRYEVDREFAGLVMPAQSTDLGFELGGKIASLTVNEGEHVSSGSVVAALDVQLLRDRRDELRAQKQEITASISLNRLNNKRIVDLESRGFASRQRADELHTEHETLLARNAQVNAALNTNQTRIDKSTLVAPFDGVISDRFVDVGAVVTAGSPVLRLLQSSRAEARIGVPVRLLGSLSVGKLVKLSVGGQITQGQIITVGQDVTQATLTVPVRVALAPDAPAVYGDQAYLTLRETVEQSGFWVPLEALTEGMRGLWNVYVAKADGDDYEIEARDVRLLHADGARAFINGAVTHGEALVQSGLHRLVPGQRVIAVDGPAAAHVAAPVPR
ncbi:MAG: efflux RND transporter periplasmic adaptor subunit [Lysobacterales bacterium]